MRSSATVFVLLPSVSRAADRGHVHVLQYLLDEAGMDLGIVDKEGMTYVQ